MTDPDWHHFVIIAYLLGVLSAVLGFAAYYLTT